jgi:hypothetical protein
MLQKHANRFCRTLKLPFWLFQIQACSDDDFRLKHGNRRFLMLKLPFWMFSGVWPIVLKMFDKHMHIGVS